MDGFKTSLNFMCIEDLSSLEMVYVFSL